MLKLTIKSILKLFLILYNIIDIKKYYKNFNKNNFDFEYLK